MNAKAVIIPFLAAILSSCGAGSGDGLNENGIPIERVNDEPIDDDAQGVTLDLLQRTIFGEVCAECHIGSNAPQGLRLDSKGNSFNFLVNQNANEVPSLMRVNPGNPEESYLLHKVEGRRGIVGSRMPLGQTPLSEQDINNIRDWIANGAPLDGVGLASTKITLLNGRKTDNTFNITVRFSRAIDPESFTKNDVLIYANSDNFSELVDSEMLSYRFIDNELHLDVELPADTGITGIDFTINHPSYSAISDVNGRLIDGDNTNFDGGMRRHVFEL